MPKVSAEYEQQQRRRIVGAARRLFAEQGIHPTRMADVIAAAGVSASTLYRHFRSKEDLILASTTQKLADVTEYVQSLRNAPDDLTPGQALLGWLESGMGELAGTDFDVAAQLALNIWAEGRRNPALREQVVAGHRLVVAAVTDVAREWRRRGKLRVDLDPETVARVMWSYAEGLIVRSALSETISLADAEADLDRLLLAEPGPVPAAAPAE